MRAGVRSAVPSAETPFLQVSTAYSFYTQALHSKSPLLIPHYWLTTPPASFVLVWIPRVRGKNLWAEYVLKVILGSWSEGVVGEKANAGQMEQVSIVSNWREGCSIQNKQAPQLWRKCHGMGRAVISKRISLSCSRSQRWAAGQHPSTYLTWISFPTAFIPWHNIYINLLIHLLSILASIPTNTPK